MKTKSSNITIRPMTVHDIPDVIELGEKLFTADKWPTLYRTWDENGLVESFLSDGHLCFVSEADGNVKGFVIGSVFEKSCGRKYGYIVWLAVAPRHQRRGVARRLLTKIKRALREEGVHMILVDTARDNKPARRFFRKNGFGAEQQHVFLSMNMTRSGRKRSVAHA